MTKTIFHDEVLNQYYMYIYIPSGENSISQYLVRLGFNIFDEYMRV